MKPLMIGKKHSCEEEAVINHKYTIEIIFHFTCSECKNWWSIALTHVSDNYPEGRAYCPHCGKESITEKLEIK